MDSEQIVDAALAAAGITVSEAERAALVGDYPLLRAGADRLYEFGDHLEPPLRFDPTTFYGDPA